MQKEKNKVSIKNWSKDDRPREKLIAKGVNVLSNAELIAILIGSGNRKESAVSLAQKILKFSSNNLNTLAKLSLHDLMQFNGIGEAKAISIITALEVGKRRNLEKAMQVSKINSSKEVFDIMHPIMRDLTHEEFWVVYLNNSNKVIAKFNLSKGGITGTMVDTRLLFKKAIELQAVGVILCHNHPSGSLKPSNADKQMTSKIIEAGNTLDIKVLDHLIIIQTNYFSFADEGILV